MSSSIRNDMSLSNDILYGSKEPIKTDKLPLRAHNNLMTVHTGGSSDYYTLPTNCHELLDIIVKKDMGFLQGEIFKAAYRWDVKPDLEYNLRKLIYFAEYELKRLYKTYPGNPRADDESQ